MVSTVTTTTVSTVTSAVGLAASLGLIAVLILISFLVAKELAGATDHPRLQRLSRFLNVAQRVGSKAEPVELRTHQVPDGE